MSATSGLRRGWGRWRWAAAVLCLGLVCSIAWGCFVWFRTGEHPGGEVAAGSSWTSPKGFRVELVGYTAASSVLDADDKPRQAPPGTQWVVVTMQYHDVAKDTVCGTIDLAGPDGMQWSSADDAPLLDGPVTCGSDGAGSNPRIHTVFEVPEALLPRVRGVLLDHTMMLRQPPLFLRP